MKLKAIGILFTAVSLIACFDTSTNSESTTVSCDVKSGLYNLNDNHVYYESTDANVAKSICDSTKMMFDHLDSMRTELLNNQIPIMPHSLCIN